MRNREELSKTEKKLIASMAADGGISFAAMHVGIVGAYLTLVREAPGAVPPDQVRLLALAALKGGAA